MPKLSSGRHIGITAERLADLARQYEETGGPTELERAQGIEDLKPFIDVLYFHAATPIKAPKAATGSKLLSELTPYPSGFTLATIEEEMRSWPEDDREAFNAFLRRSDIIDLLKSAFSRVLNAQVARKLKTGAEPTKDDAMKAVVAFMLSDKSGMFTDDDPDSDA